MINNSNSQSKSNELQAVINNMLSKNGQSSSDIMKLISSLSEEDIQKISVLIKNKDLQKLAGSFIEANKNKEQ